MLWYRAMDEWSPPEPDALPDELLHLVKPELQPGERLLWASRAGVGSTIIRRIWPSSWPASIWFLGFATVGLTSLVALAPDE